MSHERGAEQGGEPRRGATVRELAELLVAVIVRSEQRRQPLTHVNEFVEAVAGKGAEIGEIRTMMGALKVFDGGTPNEARAEVVQARADDTMYRTVNGAPITTPHLDALIDAQYRADLAQRAANEAIAAVHARGAAAAA